MVGDPFGPYLSESISREEPSAPSGAVPPPIPATISHPTFYLPQYPPPMYARHVSDENRIWPTFVLPTILIAGQFFIGIVFGVTIVLMNDGVGDAETIMKTLAKPAFAIPLFSSIAIMNISGTLLAGGLSPQRIYKRLAIGPSTANFFTLPLLAIGGFSIGGVMSSLLEILSKALGLIPGGAMALIHSIVQNTGPRWFIVLFLVIALGPAVGEELLFRGYVQTRLRQRVGIVWAIVIAAVMFGVMHLSLMQSIAVIPMGAFWGWAAYRTGSTRTAIICHMFNNLMVILMTMFGPAEMEYGSYQYLWIAAGLFAVAAFTCALLANWLLPAAPPATVNTARAGAPVPAYQFPYSVPQ